jgi:CheY-like chemotaxis protein
MKLLYIEDNEINRLVIQKGLQSYIEVITEGNGFKGVEIALSDIFDFILIDLNLSDPNIDGFGVLKQLKERGHTAKMIAITAFSGGDWEKKCALEGFDLYIPKPLSPKDVWSKLSGLLKDDSL